MTPFVSVIVPAFNASKTILETLDSIFSQTYTNFECIVVDDGSDDTFELKDNIKEYLNRDNFKYIYKSNAGVSSARNLGAKNASGEYYLFVDSDDKIADSYIEKCVQAFALDLSLTLVCTDVQEFERSNRRIRHEVVSLDKFIFHNAIFPCIALIKASDFNRVGGYDERMKVCEDWNLYISLLKHNDHYQIIHENLYYYRKRNDLSSLTDKIDTNTIRMDHALGQLCENHLEVYSAVLGDNWSIVDHHNVMLKAAKKYARIACFIFALSFVVFLSFVIFELPDYVLILNVLLLIFYVYLYMIFKKKTNKSKY